MHVWICNSCHANIPEKEKPKTCPVCGGYRKGFDEGERKEEGPDDKKYTQIYEKVVKKLEEYEEGCEPTSIQCLID